MRFLSNSKNTIAITAIATTPPTIIYVSPEIEEPVDWLGVGVVVGEKEDVAVGVGVGVDGIEDVNDVYWVITE